MKLACKKSFAEQKQVTFNLPDILQAIAGLMQPILSRTSKMMPAGGV